MAFAIMLVSHFAKEGAELLSSHLGLAQDEDRDHLSVAVVKCVAKTSQNVVVGHRSVAKVSVVIKLSWPGVKIQL